VTFTPNPGQQRALDETLTIGKRFCLLYGGSRSGKTALLVGSVQDRSLIAPNSRHLIVRKEATAAKRAIVMDTFPKVWELKYGPDAPKPEWKDRDGYFLMPNESQVWVGGINDEKAMERILGNEYGTIYENEASEIQYGAHVLLRSRLAQVCTTIEGKTLPQRLYVDLNPTTRMHWTYRLWREGMDPQDEVPIDREQYAFTVINPYDNVANLSGDFLADLEALPERQKKRFLRGEYVSDDEQALWRRTFIRRSVQDELGNWPVTMRRIVIGVDPAISTNPGSDETGIVAVGLGSDGNGYVLADESGKYRPEEWARRTASLFKSLDADKVIGEVNQGGDMVESVLRAQAPDIPYRPVRATRGKVTRAEPVAALYERGKMFHVGPFPDLEDQMCFPAGVPVWTSRGNVPIEAVATGDFVMTRNGFAPVKVARQTGVSSEFVVISTADNRRLECTANHPIYTANRGFVPAANVRVGDRLLDERSLESMAGRCGGVADGITGCGPDTSATQKAFSCIARFGRRTTASFLKGCTFITAMATQEITTSPIWNAFPRLLTMGSTQRGDGMAAARMAQQRLACAGRNGQGAGIWNTDANNAAVAFRAASQSPSSARTFADSAFGRQQAQLTEFALSAARGFGQQTRESDIVVSGVAKTQTAPRGVYNLEVELGHLPEYFAGGFLVHNCSVTTGFDPKVSGWSPDRVDALVWACMELFPTLSARSMSSGPIPAPQFTMV
jgi:Terminase RNaseH-like domain